MPKKFTVEFRGDLTIKGSYEVEAESREDAEAILAGILGEVGFDWSLTANNDSKEAKEFIKKTGDLDVEAEFDVESELY